MFGLSSSIRVGLPSPGDPEGANGPGTWWMTGGCRPAYMWDRADRPPRRRRFASFIRSRVRGHGSGISASDGGSINASHGAGETPGGPDEGDVSGTGI